MVQIVATLVSLLVGISALAVIASSLAADWGAFKRALFLQVPSSAPPLPPHVRTPAPARRARMVRITPAASPRRAAA